MVVGAGGCVLAAGGAGQLHTRASAVAYLVPVVALTLGAIALNERLTPNLLTGANPSLTGIAISRRKPSKSEIH